MSEAIFTLSTLAGLFFLFRKRTVFPGDTPRRAETWKLVLSGSGALLIAIPGVISLVTLCPAPSPVISPLDEESITLPAGEPVDILEAGAFVVRGFVTAEGAGNEPVDFFSGVIPVGAEADFSLKDGSDLKLRLKRAKAPYPSEEDEIRINCRWKVPRSVRFCEGPVDVPSPSKFEPRHGVFERIFEIPGTDTSAFGSLLIKTRGEMKVRLLLTPVGDTQSFTTRPGRKWRNEQGERISEFLSTPPPLMAAHWSECGSSSHDFVAGGLTGPALLSLLAGTLLIIIASTSRLRAVCLLILYLCLYAGTIDSCVLRCHSARLDSNDTAIVRAAAIEVSSTRLHSATAARDLLERARSEQDPVLCRHLLQCLDRPALLKELSRMEDASATLATIAAEGEGGPARTAKRIGRDLERYSQNDL